MSGSAFFGRPILVCPACGSRDRTLFVCSRCWQRVPPRDRAILRGLHVNRQPTESKVASVVRRLKGEPAS